MSILMKKIIPLVGEVGKSGFSGWGLKGERCNPSPPYKWWIPVALSFSVFLVSWSFGRLPRMDQKCPEF